MPKSSASSSKRTFQNPKGTRDFYPEDQLRQRYITDAWRRVALRHGFEEIDGPTFEHLDLYTVKSGEGIVSELFSFRREGGDDTYALRPEFTPTLARMYAARAKQLSVPVRWFSVCNYFRAERPQRGRLREFLQWNVDVIGLGGGDSNTEDTEGTEKRKAEADGELIAACAAVFNQFGIDSEDIRLRVAHRGSMVSFLSEQSIDSERMEDAFRVFDAATKVDDAETTRRIEEILGSSNEFARGIVAGFRAWRESLFGPLERLRQLLQNEMTEQWPWRNLVDAIDALGFIEQCDFDPSIVRGLAYYTGTVFEAIAEGERAVAGGGRYDNLIELMGGPPTPAAGFAMGDVVLGNILDDKGLIPAGRELLEALSRPMPVRPDVFVVSAKEEAGDAIVRLVSALRRGVEAEDAQGKKPWDESRFAIRPLHARRSSKSTRNVGKLLKEASSQHARFCVILESEETCTIKDLDTQQQTDKPVSIEQVGAIVAGHEHI